MSIPYPLPRSLTLLSEVALNAASSARTGEWVFGPLRPTRLGLDWSLTHNAATDLSINVEVSTDGGLSYFPITSRKIDSGVGAVSDYTDTKTVSDDSSAHLDYDIQGATAIRVSVSGTSGGASDLVTVNARLS